MSGAARGGEGAALGPADTPLRATTRFLVELAAWVTVPWALWDRSAVLALAGAAVLIATPAALNVPGDKRVTGIAVPGAVRLAIELALYAAAAWGLIAVVGGGAGTIGAVAVAAAAAVQVPRWRWLVRSGAGL